MLRNLLSPISAGVGAGLRVWGPPEWGLTGAAILAASATGEHGAGLAANDGLDNALRYVYRLDTRSTPTVRLYPDSSHTGPVPYSGTVRVYEQGTGEVAASLAARSFSVSTPAAPSIATQPQPQAVLEGAAAAFSVAAIGTAPLAYQWRRNGTAISGATAASYTLSSTTLADSGALFSVLVSNAAGSVTSASASLTVQTSAVAPAITTQPQGQTLVEGTPAVFSVSASGTAPLAYQWRRNGVAITGATSSSYTLASPTLGDSGAVFSVAVTNTAGSAVSLGAALTVLSAALPPTITAQPQPLQVPEGAAASFSVAAAGTAPLSYQWRRNGVAISGATASIYTLSSVTQADNGVQFSVLVSNAAGSAASATAVLSVSQSTAPPVITTQPITQVVEDGDIATFTVHTSGALPITYQWQRDGVNIPGATAATLQFGPVTLLDNRAGIRVRCSNFYGSVLSRKADLRVPVVSLATARTGARIDDDRFDADIPRWVDTALSLAEQYCNRYFAPKNPEFGRVSWPGELETFPVYSARAATVTWWDGAAWQTLAPEAFVYFPVGNRTGLAPALGTSWPTLGDAPGGPRVRVQFTVGPATAAEVPEEVVAFVLAHVALWADEHRAAGPSNAQNYPWLYAGLDPHKVY
jgi:hypothetical protein